MFQGKRFPTKVLQQLWVLGAVGDDGLDAWPWFDLQVTISTRLKITFAYLD